jgi:hypothetical protein
MLPFKTFKLQGRHIAPHAIAQVVPAEKDQLMEVHLVNGEIIIVEDSTTAQTFASFLDCHTLDFSNVKQVK